MPTLKKRFRALRGVSVRKSKDQESPKWDEFHHWEAGDFMDDAPAYTDFRGLLEVGAVEEVKDG